MSRSSQTNSYNDVTIPADSPLADLFYNSCGLLSAEEMEEFNDGFQKYHFEGHCVEFTIHAKKIGREWIVRKTEMRDC